MGLFCSLEARQTSLAVPSATLGLPCNLEPGFSASTFFTSDVSSSMLIFLKVAQVVREAGPSFEFTGALEAAALVVAALLVADDAALLATADADALVVFDPGAEAAESSWWPPHAARAVVIAPSATIVAPRATITESRFIYTYPESPPAPGTPTRSQRTVSSASASLRRGREAKAT